MSKMKAITTLVCTAVSVIATAIIGGMKVYDSSMAVVNACKTENDAEDLPENPTENEEA